MKRKEFYQVLAPLPEMLYTLAYSLLPDDLQAEQLVIDAVNAFILKNKRWIIKKEVNLQDKKELQLVRKTVFKTIIRQLGNIGTRRALQLTEQMKPSVPEGFAKFYALDPKVRLVLRLRYENQFSVDEIVDIFEIPRYEVIEKLHNGRYLLNSEATL